MKRFWMIGIDGQGPMGINEYTSLESAKDAAREYVHQSPVAIVVFEAVGVYRYEGPIWCEFEAA